jgi:hypothetical protein
MDQPAPARVQTYRPAAQLGRALEDVRSAQAKQSAEVELALHAQAKQRVDVEKVLEAANAKVEQLAAGLAAAQRSIDQMTAELKKTTAREAQTIDEALARDITPANLAFNAPERARVGKQFRVEAKVSKRLSPEEMKVLIDADGKIEVVPLKVSKKMFASLLGGSAFDVTPSTPVDQGISDTETTDWYWQVTPKSVGKQTLTLSFEAVYSVRDKEQKRTLPPFSKTIEVDVAWPETIGEWLELIKKTGENVSYIWLMLLVPAGGIIWAAIKRFRRSPTSDEEELFSTG